jgi:hypothetical protein
MEYSFVPFECQMRPAGAAITVERIAGVTTRIGTD